MGRLLVLLFALMFIGSSARSQGLEADSLIHALRDVGRTKERVDLLNLLAYEYYDIDSHRAFGYSMEALNLARELDYARGERRALTLTGFYFSTRGNFDSALSYYRASAKVDLPHDGDLAYNHVLMGNAFRAEARYDSAFFHYERAISILNDSASQFQKAYAYRNLAELNAMLWNTEEAERLLKEAMEIYERTGRYYGLAECWFLMAQLRRNQSAFEEAEEYVSRGCELADGIGDDFLELRCMMIRGQVAHEFGEHTRALTYYFQVLGILRSADNLLTMTSLYRDIGDVYYTLGQHSMAMRYYSQARDVADSIGARREYADIVARTARVAAGQGNFEAAHEDVNRSLEIRQEIADTFGIAHSYVVLGQLYYQQKQYDEALEAYQRALELRQNIGDRSGISSCYYNMSFVHVELNQLTTALSYQRQGLAIEESMGYAYGLAYSHNQLGRLYTRLRDYPRAARHLAQATSLAANIESKSLRMENHRFWSDYYKARGQVANAFEHFQQYAALRDSIHSEIDAQKLAELQAMYTMERKEAEIRLLNQERLLDQQQIDLQRAQIYRQNIIIGSVVVSLLLLSLLMYKTWQYSNRMEKAHREISEQKEEIESQSEELREASEEIARINKALESKIGQRTEALSQAYKELDTFFYRASHDFRRPLTTFMGLAEVAKVTVKDTNALELFDKVRETASNLDKMLVKLQSISDMGSQQLVIKEVRLKEIFDTVCDSYRDELERKRIRASTDVNIKGPFVSYPALIRIIVENLVENAIHFSGVDKPYIQLTATESSGMVTLEVRDNGQGISPEYQPLVFDMYFRANERSKGNGLGLYIVKKAVEKLDGSITLSSIAKTGTTFTVMLPNHNGTA